MKRKRNIGVDLNSFGKHFKFKYSQFSYFTILCYFLVYIKYFSYVY